MTSIESGRKPLAVITGGAGYLGGAFASELVGRGWNVVSLSRNPGSTSGEGHACDITDEPGVRDAIESIVSEHGPIHACIHAAASPLDRKPMLSLSSAAFETPVSVALQGAFALAKAAAPRMLPHSVFIGITSEAIEPGISPVRMGSYAPAKYALRGFLRVLAEELKPQQIRVNAVAPGFLPGGLNGDLPRAMIDLIQKKSGVSAKTLDDVAKTVARLCVEQSAFPAGTSISISSGKVSAL